jgi:hypothetical protein
LIFERKVFEEKLRAAKNMVTCFNNIFYNDVFINSYGFLTPGCGEEPSN